MTLPFAKSIKTLFAAQRTAARIESGRRPAKSDVETLGLDYNRFTI
ncbi:MAG: hypothetical protein AAF468_16665 [Pseudomonadota bacterium]